MVYMKDTIYSIEGKYYYSVLQRVCYELVDNGSRLEPVFKLVKIGNGLYRTQIRERRVPTGIIRKATDIAERYDGIQDIPKHRAETFKKEMNKACMTR